MKKNTGLKVLTGTVIAVVALILMSSNPHENELSTSIRDPNNLNEAIASQFNDNIRSVAAKLQETEKQLAGLQLDHEQLKRKNADIQSFYGPEIFNPMLNDSNELDKTHDCSDEKQQT